MSWIRNHELSNLKKMAKRGHHLSICVSHLMVKLGYPVPSIQFEHQDCKHQWLNSGNMNHISLPLISFV